MTNRHYFSSIIFLAAISISLSSCVTTDFAQLHQSKALMEHAQRYAQQGYHYNAVSYALDSLAISGEESTRQFIKQNLDKAFDQGIQKMKTDQLNVENLNSFRIATADLSSFQEKLKKYQFISTDKVNIPLVQEKYELALSQLLLQEMRNSSEKGDMDGLAKGIEAYKVAGWAVNQSIIAFINRVFLGYAEQGKIGDLIKFFNDNKDYVNEDTRKNFYAKLYDFAVSLEPQNKQNALELFIFLNEQRDYRDQRVPARIAAIKSELLTRQAENEKLADASNETAGNISLKPDAIARAKRNIGKRFWILANSDIALQYFPTKFSKSYFANTTDPFIVMAVRIAPDNTTLFYQVRFNWGEEAYIDVRRFEIGDILGSKYIATTAPKAIIAEQQGPEKLETQPAKENKEREQLEKAKQKSAPKVKKKTAQPSTTTTAEANQRKEFAKFYEQAMLGKGLDVYAAAVGEGSKTFKIKYVLLSRPLVYQIVNDGSTMNNLKQLGFEKVLLTDGYDETWTVELRK